MTQKDGVQQLVKEIESREKCLCILVNNAGVASSKTSPDAKDAAELKKTGLIPRQWTSVYATNVVGPFLMATAFLPLLQRATEQHHGYSATIINITSISGMLKPAKTSSPRAGLKMRVNAIVPGVFPSEMTTGDSGGDQKSSMPKEERDCTLAYSCGAE
ncbi:hypothetical protein B0H14DRAFT_3443073 [Mycena olivaceomarginata]|nr:hypothetical protein B0H14DRAFT_3443073 [Mycena olivaceomarginata]